MTAETSAAGYLLTFVPFACCWAMVRLFLAAGRFVNGLRDNILSGHVNAVPITPAHQGVLAWDWMISMTGIFLTCAAFHLLFKLSAEAVAGIDGAGSAALGPLLKASLQTLAAVPLVAAGGFLLCALVDLRGIWRAVKGVMG